MNHWLVKTEPHAFSWEQQVAHGVEPWTGVRNHAAKNHLNLPPQLPMQASSLLSYLSPPAPPPQSGQAGLN